MKKLKQRLLSMILVVLMVAGMLPVGQMASVNAADTKRVYLDFSELSDSHMSNWTNPHIYAFNSSGATNSIFAMTKVNDDLFYADISSSATSVIFATTSVWSSQTNDLSLSSVSVDYVSTFPVYKMTTYTSGSTKCWSGYWSTYSSGSSDTTTSSTFYVQTDLVDYLNDSRVSNSQVSGYYTGNQGDNTGDKVNDTPYGYINYAISQQGYNFPLYFGSLNYIKMRYGWNGSKQSLSKWNTGANVAPADNSGNGNYNASVQGLVDSTLSSSGNLQQNGKELPYFSKTMASSLKVNGYKVMNYYSDLEFPFKAEYDETTGITTYSYDSLNDYAVYYNYSDRQLQTSTTHVTNLYDGKNGYYPLNKSSDTGNNVNMGFGTKFTIPFTVNENGTFNGLTSGEAVTFNFTGDDDVWVFIDGQLVLDMGGAHTTSSGSINFKTLSATVKNAYTVRSSQTITSGNTYELSTYKNQDLDNYIYSDTEERDAVSSGSVTTLFPASLKAAFKSEYAAGKAEVHTLTMFYMERGMYDSNMSIEFTMNPIPSGLVVSKDIETANLNDGLESAVENVDDFEFTVSAKKLSDNSTVSFSKYTLTDHTNKSTTVTTSNNTITGVRADQYANTFLDSNGNNAFVAGTGFTITETIPEDSVFQYESTEWKLYDADNGYEKISSGTTTTASFDMGTSSSDSTMESYNYSINYINKMKVGNLSLTKNWNEDQEKPSGTYDFTILIDLDGESGDKFTYTAYALVGDTATADSNGQVSLAAGQTVVFEGIPAGASYQIVENIPSDASYSSDKTNNTVTGAIASDSTSGVVFTNSFNTKTLDAKVIYVEAGNTTSDYTVTDPSDNGKVTITSVTTVEGVTIDYTDGVLDVTAKDSDQKYEISYVGKKDDGTIIKGTIVIYSYSATKKVYVFDYGLESDLTVTNGSDGLFEGGVFYNQNTTGSDQTTASLEEVQDKAGCDNSQTNIVMDEYVKILESGKSEGAVTFEAVAFMDQVEYYTYKAEVAKIGVKFDSANPETGTYVNGTIEVMPANSVYYEDNFNAETNTTDGSLKIVYTNSSNAPKSNPTDTQSNDQSENYGHDDAYSNDLEASGGSFTEMQNGDGAYFTFKGTGFDIISRTNSETAGIAVYVFKGPKTEFTTDDFKATKDSEGNVTTPYLKMIMVDTYYSNGDLYQVPVISTTMDQGYGEYTVYIKALSTYTGQSVIYIDGVRIYNPLETANDAYLDTEKDIAVKEIRQLLLDDDQINLLAAVLKTETVTDIEEDEDGIEHEYTYEIPVLDDNDKCIVEELVVDEGTTAVEYYLPVEEAKIGGYEAVDNESLDSVLTSGPNNELYIPNYNGFCFSINEPDMESWTLQIGAKAVNKDEATNEKAFTVYIKPDSSEENQFKVVKEYVVNTSTDMYYDIEAADLLEIINANSWDDDRYDIMILNTSADNWVDYDLISFTTVKYHTCSTCNNVLKKLSSVQSGPISVYAEGINAQTLNEESVLSAKFNVSNVSRGKNVTMTVVTTAGVEDVMVTDPSGANVKCSKKTSKVDADGNLVWSLTFSAVKQKGSATYQVVGVVDGEVTGDAYSVTIAVR